MKLDLPQSGGRFAILDNSLIVSRSDPHRNLLAQLLNDPNIRNISIADNLKLQKVLAEEYRDRLDLGGLISFDGISYRIYGKSSEFEFPLEADKPKIRAVTL